MMLLVFSAILASLAFGVVIAYATCSILFRLFRMHVRATHPAPLPMQAKIAHP
jgi:uncharacterized membrane protein